MTSRGRQNAARRALAAPRDTISALSVRRTVEQRTRQIPSRGTGGLAHRSTRTARRLVLTRIRG